MNFGKWNADIHDTPDQIKRIASAQKISASKITLNKESKTCLIQGSAGVSYEVSLNDCDCADFSVRGLPCKHIYRLAIELGLTNDMPVFNKKAASEFNDTIEAEIEKFLQYYKKGAITGEKFAKIADALRKGK